MNDYEVIALQKTIKSRLLNINSDIRKSRHSLSKEELAKLKLKRKTTDQLYQRSLKIIDTNSFCLVKQEYLGFM